MLAHAAVWSVRWVGWECALARGIQVIRSMAHGSGRSRFSSGRLLGAGSALVRARAGGGFPWFAPGGESVVDGCSDVVAGGVTWQV